MPAARRMMCSVLLVIVAAGCGAEGNRGATQSSHITPETTSAFDAAKEPPIACETRYAAGQLAESQNNPANAMAQYEAALRTKPDHLPSLYRLGVIAAQLKQYPKAIETWNRYLEVTDHSASGYANLGFCHELAGDWQAAKAAYEKGIAKDPRHQPCRVNYGLMLARQDRMSDAINHLRAVLTPAEVSYNIGSIHEQQGRLEQAKAEYQKALALDPQFNDARQRLAALE